MGINNQSTISYTIINHTARLELGITNAEYIFLDLVSNLSSDPRFGKWCIAKKTKLAEMAEISEQHVHRLIKKFATGKYTVGNNTITCPLLLEKDPKTKNVRTTSLWYETVVIKKELLKKHKENIKQTSSQKSTSNTNDSSTQLTQANRQSIKEISYFLERWKEINPLNYKKFSKVKMYREAEQTLLNAIGSEKLDILHDKLPIINQTDFLAHSYTPSELLRNYPRYLDHAVMKTTKRSVEKVA